MASNKSLPIISLRFSRAAKIADSFKMLAKSAPEKPDVLSATLFKLTSFANGFSLT